MLTTQKIPDIKKKKKKNHKFLLSSLSYLISLEAIKKQLALLLTHYLISKI